MRGSNRLPLVPVPTVAVLLGLALMVLGGCFTVPTAEDIPPDLDRATIFQFAQIAADVGNWEGALAYYQIYLERFPSQTTYFVVAHYEIGFIYYRQRNYAAARAELQEVLSYYETDEDATEVATPENNPAEPLPLWPQALARKVLAAIDEATGSTTTEAE